MGIIELTSEQEDKVAFSWIKKQQDSRDGYKKVLSPLLTGCYFAKWSWSDAIIYAIRICSKNYCSTYTYILNNVKEALYEKQD